MSFSDPTVMFTALTVLALGFMGIIFGGLRKLARNQTVPSGTSNHSHSGIVTAAVVIFIAAFAIFLLSRIN